MLAELQRGRRVVGTKQTLKEIGSGRAEKVFVAENADREIRDEVISTAQKHGIDVVQIETMQELGAACEIEVGAAAAALVS